MEQLENKYTEWHCSIFFQTLLEVTSLQLMTDPLWINEEIKCKIKSKNKTFQQYLKNEWKKTDFEIEGKEAQVSEMIQNQKDKYFYDLSLKLNNLQTRPKTYYSIIKSCYSGRKIPMILPLSLSGKIITNFKEKANLFNKCFSMKSFTK